MGGLRDCLRFSPSPDGPAPPPACTCRHALSLKQKQKWITDSQKPQGAVAAQMTLDCPESSMNTQLPRTISPFWDILKYPSCWHNKRPSFLWMLVTGPRWQPVCWTPGWRVIRITSVTWLPSPPPLCSIPSLSAPTWPRDLLWQVARSHQGFGSLWRPPPMWACARASPLSARSRRHMEQEGVNPVEAILNPPWTFHSRREQSKLRSEETPARTRLDHLSANSGVPACWLSHSQHFRIICDLAPLWHG